jgi:hypothetical protein
MAAALGRLLLGQSMKQMARPKLHLAEHAIERSKEFRSDDEKNSEAKHVSRALEDARRGDVSSLRHLAKQLGVPRLQNELEKLGVKDDILKDIGADGNKSFNVLKKTCEEQ